MSHIPEAKLFHTITPRRRILEVVGWIIGAVAIIWGANTYIDSRIDSKIEAKLMDEATIRKIAAHVRPSCIFDERGSVVFDSGAMQWIDRIEPLPMPKEVGTAMTELPYKIVLHCNRHLAYAPILTILDPYFASISVERGPMFDWVYTIEIGSGIIGTGAEKTWGKHCRYRVEIL